jgi:hypothetical protein
MPPAYSFNLAPDRFDTHVINALAATKATRHMRDRLIAQVRQGRLDHMLLRRLGGLEDLPAELCERAAINVIDFHFEPLALASMSRPQLASYLQSAEKTLRLGEVEAFDASGPLWIDSVHHACVFSVLYLFAAYLARQRRYRKLLLLNQGLRPEPRLPMVIGLLRQIAGVEAMTLQLRGNWFAELTRMATPETAVFYLTDMPLETSQRSAPKARALSQLQLGAPPNVSVRLETLSGSGVFARRLNAEHVVIDYPAADRVRIRPYDAASPVCRCPLEDWVFWPLLDVAPAV